MRTARKITVVTMAMGVIAIGSPADAAASVAIATTSRAGDTLTVSGSASFVDQPFMVVGTDTADDAPTGFDQAGGDLVAVEASTALSGAIRLRLTMKSLPAGTYGTPLLSYGWAFCVRDESLCYQLDIQRNNLAPGTTGFPTAPIGFLSRCATASCDSSGLTRVEAPGAVGFDPGCKCATATIPASIASGSGTTILPATKANPAFSMLGTVEPATRMPEHTDVLSTIATYTAPVQEVSIGIGPSNLSPAAVKYGPPTSPTSTGAWTAEMSVAGLSGARSVFARACFGANNCVYTKRSVTL